jgi:CO/xanthine dehydrogenase Mo-binding subunit/aerobic-type carbon monoxide dehydrogenase small subunit (CoxS/CutS family)
MTARPAIASIGPGLVEVMVNGRLCTSSRHPATPLVTVLRDEWQLKGTKIGCSAGDCGACTVLLEGRQVCSCITALGRCAGRAVTTVEGLADEGRLNALQQAFLEQGATQCGICTPGMLMAATDLLRRTACPSEEEISTALAGVLCRCTGYRKIIEAVQIASGQLGSRSAVPAFTHGHDRQPPAGAAVGARLPRLDAHAKLTGTEVFGADLAPAGCLAMRILRSPHPHARFEFGDWDAFKASHPGVIDVITASDIPNNRFAIFEHPKDQPVLAEGLVRMRGEAIAAVVGDEASLSAIEPGQWPVTWYPEPALETPAAALAEGVAALHAFAPENILCQGHLAKGGVDEALAGAACVAHGHFRTAYVEHAYIEPEAGYAELVIGSDALGEATERVRIFASTQTPYMDRDEVARVLKRPASSVHIVPSAVGGGFGGKLDLAIQPLLAVAALKLRRPVRIVYSREESMLSTTKRHPAEITARYGCDQDGNLVGLDFQADFNTGAYASWGSTVANRVPVHATGPYRVPHVRAHTRAVYTHNTVAGAFRGFGVPQAHIATEALLDDLADALGWDRLEFRLRNALRAGDATATGQVLLSSVGIGACLTALRAPWQDALGRANSWNEKAKAAGLRQRQGVGIASMWYGIGNTVIANPSTMHGALRQNGRLYLYNGAQEIGQGSATVIPQIFADAVGLPIELVDQVVGDTDLTLDAGKSSASRQTFVSGNAARLAGEDLRRQLLERLGAGPSARLSIDRGAPGALLCADETLRSTRLSLAELPANDHGDVVTGSGSFNPPTVPLDANGQGVPYATYGFAAQFALVEVDLDLGTVKVLDLHAAHDVGRAVNPTQVEGQIHGGIAQGLGMALMEEYRSGQTDNLHDYLIPTIGDIPAITTYLIEDPEPLGPYGAKGVGEPALIATAPAILNAIHHASGAWVREIPVTPDRLRRALLERAHA